MVRSFGHGPRGSRGHEQSGSRYAVVVPSDQLPLQTGWLRRHPRGTYRQLPARGGNQRRDKQCLQFVYTWLMAAETTTVRVRRPDSERLQSLAKARQIAVVDVVHAAIDALERQEFLRGLNGDYQRLRSDPELWEQYLAERRDWDALA